MKHWWWPRNRRERGEVYLMLSLLAGFSGYGLLAWVVIAIAMMWG